MRRFAAKYQREIFFSAAIVALSAGIALALWGATAWWALAANALAWGVVALTMMPYNEEQDEIPEVLPQQQIAAIERITVRSGSKIRVLAVSEISYIRADGDYVEIVAKDGHWLKEQTMKWFEEQLPTTDFFRIHRSYIVNLSSIARIERYGTSYHVQLHSGETLTVSSGRYKLLREQLGL